MGLTDRGVIREGLRADFTIFDYDRINDSATWEQPTAAPTGIDYVVVIPYPAAMIEFQLCLFNFRNRMPTFTSGRCAPASTAGCRLRNVNATGGNPMKMRRLCLRGGRRRPRETDHEY